MSKKVIILYEEDIKNIQSVLNICAKEFKRDETMGRESCFNELGLLSALSSAQLEGWVFGDAKGRNDDGE